ncbi:Do family serine endopeptidase [Siccirubricoccus sp. G192]|uniref:Do family serine endopeptidase n=1 Tax=Siccirubricoccus sp. G192 TaxID=2849651 RepID=UPI001C2C85FF|nr:Do family serine endopeptidase [Siccirubricoccus sp. G192]MBV1799663.1 Do family serine endopeptidase [Siccirubricoccus sp. G192]
MPKTNPRRGAILASGVLALALATTALVPLPHQATAQQAPAASTAIALPRPAGPDFADLAAKVTPAVVRVSVIGHVQNAAAEIPPELRGTPFEEFFRRYGGSPTPRRIAGQGSGFIIDPAGFIVTNNHVVGNADQVKVELADGRDLPAKVVGTDPQTDLALLKVEAGGALPTVAFGDSDHLRVGEWVVAMGNPFGLGASATAGIVSARGRQIGAGPYDDFIQTDAPINPGNSGGPLFNTTGEVVGVNTAIFSPSGGNIGIGFAVPSRLAQHVVAQLKDHGRVERGWLGVSMQRLDPEMAAALSVPEAKGAVVAAVEPNSPAARAGLQPGDVIVGVNGRPIAQPRALAAAVAELKPGAETKLAVLRNGERTEPQVTIGTPPNARMAQGGAAGQEREQLGLALAPNGKGEGAVVAQVAPDGLAAERGMQPGDVILRAGGQVVHGPADVAKAVDAARQAGRSAIALQIEREGGRAIVALPLRTG